jgi:hypothetical protein
MPVQRAGVQQPMQMDDEIAHLGIVDGLLRLRLPGGVGAGIARIDADNVEAVEVLEFGGIELVQLAAKHQMEQLLLPGGVGHGQFLRAGRGFAPDVTPARWSVHG